MGWTVNFFAQKASTWLRWAEKANSQQRRGHECYARKQHAFWMTMKQNATHTFQRAIQVVTKDVSVQIAGLDGDMADPEVQPDADSSNSSSTTEPDDIYSDTGSPGSVHDTGSAL